MKYISHYILESSFVKDKFMIDVSLPPTFQANIEYPLIICLDANVYFGIVSDSVRLLQFGNEIPDAIVVGVGYPDNDMHLTLRNRDYLPSATDEASLSGKAYQFHQFLENELIPDLSSKYNLNLNDKTLLGDSYSGLFALYSLFKRPNYFQRLIVGSPSIYYDNKIILELERQERNERNIETEVFLSVGALEQDSNPTFANMVGNVIEISKILKANYKNIQLTTHVFEDETHLSVIPATFSRGLRCVYKRFKK